jgi:hypothetical protein
MRISRKSSLLVTMISIFTISCATSNKSTPTPLAYEVQSPQGHIPLKVGLMEVTGCGIWQMCTDIYDKLLNDFNKSCLFDSISKSFIPEDVDIVIQISMSDFKYDRSRPMYEYLIPIVLTPIGWIIKSQIAGDVYYTYYAETIELKVLESKGGREIASYKSRVEADMTKIVNINNRYKIQTIWDDDLMQEQFKLATEEMMRNLLNDSERIISEVKP